MPNEHTKGNCAKRVLTAVFYIQMLKFSAFHRFFLILQLQC